MENQIIVYKTNSGEDKLIKTKKAADRPDKTTGKEKRR